MAILPTLDYEDEAFSPWPDVDTFYDYLPFISKEIAKLPREKLGTEIAIIGAGASGLVAAYELLKVGFKPIIYEAGNRIGGRLYSKHFTNDNGEPASAFAELGAMRIPVSSRVFYHYATQFKLNFDTLFPDPGVVDTLLYYQNQAHWWHAGEPVPDAFLTVSENWRFFVTPLVEKIHRPWRRGDMEAVGHIWQQYLERYKGMSFYEAIRTESAVWSDDDLDRFGALGIGTGGMGALFHVGFLEILRILVHRWDDRQMLIRDGVEELTRHFYEDPVDTPTGRTSLEASHALRLNTPVTAIAYEDHDHPALTFIDPQTNQPIQQRYPAIVVATTTRAMQMMGLTLPASDRHNILSDEQKSAVRNLHHVHSSKLFIRTKTKFWLDADARIPLNIQTDELPRGVYLLDYPQTDNGVVCVSYTWGDDSVRMMGLSLRRRFDILADTIGRILPELGKQLVPVNDEIIHIDWEATPHFYGAFKLQLPGQEDGARTLYYQFQSALTPESDHGVYLAGDSVSWAGGWIEGALHTGLNAATAVAQCVGARVADDSPLTQDPHRYKYA